MTVGSLDRRSLFVLVGGVAAILLVKFAFVRGGSTAVVQAEESVPAAERRLERLRQIASTIPGKEELYKKAAGQLAEREKSLLKANTVEQARVTLFEMVQNIARSNGIDARGSQEFRDKAVNNDYGQVSVMLTFTCGMEQLVNMLGAIANQPDLLATDEIHIAGGNDKKKNVQVRLSVAAAVPRKLIPERKGVGAF